MVTESQTSKPDSVAAEHSGEQQSGAVPSPGQGETPRQGDDLDHTADAPDLAQELQAAQASADENRDKLLRLQAEMDNLRKRTTRDIENAHKYALERFVHELLPVIDSLELGINAASKGAVRGEGAAPTGKDTAEPAGRRPAPGPNAANNPGDHDTIDSLREGMELTLKMLLDAVGKFGVQPVDPQGEKFDPQLHEAVTIQESREAAAGTVLSVVQKGYLLNDRLVRPAMVVVAK